MAEGTSSFQFSDQAIGFRHAFVLVAFDQAFALAVPADHVLSRKTELAVKGCRLVRLDVRE
jgi:hypothetical protein